MIEVKDKRKCCGCSACTNICPKKAIKMIPDEEGFLYPIIDKNKCINCGMCDKVCPYKNTNNVSNSFIKCYAIQNKSADVLDTSTSGGFFDTIANYVVNNNGYVCGAVFDKDNKVIHEIYGKREKENIKKFRESKYVQSDLKDCFPKIKELLQNGIIVCFSGTPCQVIGLKKYLMKEYDNLITVDFCCRSVPSPLMFEKYKKYQEKKFNSKIKEFHFRKKTFGYHHGTLRIIFENGKEYNGSNRVDLYNKAFHSDKFSRYSCYNCIGKGINRISDFTIFDSWNPETLNKEIIDNDKGYTNVFIHNIKSYKLFIEILSSKFNYYEISKDAASALTGNMLEKSIVEKSERKYVLKNIDNDENLNFIKSNIKITLFDRFIEYSKKIIYKKRS